MSPLLLILAWVQILAAMTWPMIAAAAFSVPPFVHSPSSRARRAGFSIMAAAARGDNADASSVITTSPERPIVVIGAGGKTGRIIARLLVEQERQYVRAVYRTGKSLEDIASRYDSEPHISHVVGDVTSYDSVFNLTKGAAGVVWAATSSGVKQGGGDVVQVDYQGAYNIAKACLACNVPKLAFISAGCVTRPNSLGTRAVNWMTKLSYGDYPWVDAKVAGEDAVRNLYHRANKNQNRKTRPAYVIVRPSAALSDKPPVRVGELLVMQGDVYSSAKSISRANIAQVVVRALLKGKATDFTTFEVCPAVQLYKNDEGNVFDLIGLYTLKQTTTPYLPKALVKKNAGSYGELFDRLVTDEDMLKQYEWIVNDYHAEGVPSVEKFALLPS